MIFGPRLQPEARGNGVAVGKKLLVPAEIRWVSAFATAPARFLGTYCVIRAAAGEQEVNQLQSFSYYERNQSGSLTSRVPVWLKIDAI